MQSHAGLCGFTASYAPVLADEKGVEEGGREKRPPSSQALGRTQPQENTPLRRQQRTSLGLPTNYWKAVSGLDQN